MLQKIVPFLWFEDRAEEAVNFYTSIFRDSRILSTMRYDEASAETAGRQAGSVMTIDFEIEGQRFTALNGGPQFKFTEAVSFVVNCNSQEEVDLLWEKMTSGGGQPGRCGWLKDKFGLSWQIIPVAMNLMMTDEDPAKVRRVMAAMLQMDKIELSELQKAYAGK